MLAARGLDSQVISQFVESITETACGFELFEPKHWIVTLLDSSMILLDSVVQILIVSMRNFSTDDPTNCLRVGRMFIRRHPQWLLTCTID